MDLSSETPKENRRARERAGRLQMIGPLEENTLDIPIPFDEATVLFYKADTFHVRYILKKKS